jgi:hypothetical protein
MVAESKVSDRKAEANRANARKSTGPRTLAGKARASQNARTHGLFCRDVVLEGEDVDQFNHIRRQFIQRLRPQDALELSLVERIAEGNWRLMRLNRHEARESRCDVGSPAQEEKMAMVLTSMMSGGGRLTRSALNACLGAGAAQGVDPCGPARQRAEQSIGRALRELRILQSPNKPADLPPSPYLEEEPYQRNVESDKSGCDQEENPQNEPTEAATPPAAETCERTNLTDEAPNPQPRPMDPTGPTSAWADCDP